MSQCVKAKHTFTDLESKSNQGVNVKIIYGVREQTELGSKSKDALWS